MTERYTFGWTNSKSIYGDSILGGEAMYRESIVEKFEPLIYIVGICVVLIVGFVFLAKVAGPTDEQLAQMHKMQVIHEIDGCKVYRFFDGSYHYITRCGDKVTTQKNWDESCGKACTKHRTEELVTEDNQ